MKRLIAVITLCVVVPISAKAGEIPSGDFLPPPPTNRPTSSQLDSSVAVPSVDQSSESLELLDTLLVSFASLLMR